VYFILTYSILILFSCNTGEGRFIVEEIEQNANDSLNVKNKFSYEIIYGSHFSFSTKSDNYSNKKLEDITINFNKKRLSYVLDKLEYSYSTQKLSKNPLLKIDYYKKNTTKVAAIEEIITLLKRTYQF